MSIFLKNISFCGILLDALFEGSSADWQEVSDLVNKGMASGVVRPLHTSVFDKDHVEDAFRFMAQGKHIGKVFNAHISGKLDKIKKKMFEKKYFC